ncbi:hypothetical protein GC194_01430, partial [bacterium]|nr:hypothetical protein [bacterium]
MNTQSPHQSLYYRLLRPSIVIAFCWFLYFPLYAKQFSGHYNIGKQSNSHFSSPTAALAALANDTVTGPVVFHLEEGEYFGLLELLNPVYGVSHKNTVTFTGDGADISKTIINCSVEHVLHFENVQHFRFNNLSIIVQSRYYTAGRIIIDFKDCLDIDFRNVYFDNISLSPYVKNPTTAYNVYLDHSDSCDFVNCNFHQQFISMGCHNVYYYYSKQNTLRNCVFEGGEEAFRQVGSQSDTLSTNLIDSCDISGWGKTAVYNYGFSNLMLMNTKIHDGAGAYDNGYYETNCRGTQLINNTFFVRGVGMQFSSPNNYPNNRTDTTRLINNAVSSDGFALYITGGDLLNIYHNSFRCTQYSEALVIVNSQTKRRFKVVNNIFETYGGSYVMDVNLTKGVPILWDYNNYYRHKSSSYFAYFNKNRYASYAELKKGTYGFKNSRNEDPEFDSLDVRTVATGLNNKGKKLNAGSPFVKTDIDGANRPNKFEKKVDIGPNDYYLYCKNNPTNLREHLAIGQVKLANLQKKSGLDPDGFKYYHHKTAKLRRGATYHI